MKCVKQLKDKKTGECYQIKDDIARTKIEGALPILTACANNVGILMHEYNNPTFASSTKAGKVLVSELTESEKANAVPVGITNEGRLIAVRPEGTNPTPDSSGSVKISKITFNNADELLDWCYGKLGKIIQFSILNGEHTFYFNQCQETYSDDRYGGIYLAQEKTYMRSTGTDVNGRITGISRITDLEGFYIGRDISYNYESTIVDYKRITYDNDESDIHYFMNEENVFEVGEPIPSSYIPLLNISVTVYYFDEVTE